MNLQGILLRMMNLVCLMILFCVFQTLLVVKIGYGMIESGSDLYCNFEADCKGWRNGTDGLEDSIEWETAGTVLIDAWHSIPRSIQGEIFAFVVGRGSPEPDKAWLISDTIPCLPLQSFLTFHYWKNTFLGGIFNPGIPKLTVYLREPPWTKNLRILSDFSEQNKWGWHAAAVEIPASEKPFQIVISAEIQSSYDILGIDEVLFRGYISESYCNITGSEEEKIASASGFSNTEEEAEPEDNKLLVQRLVQALPYLQTNQLQQIKGGLPSGIDTQYLLPALLAQNPELNAQLQTILGQNSGINAQPALTRNPGINAQLPALTQNPGIKAQLQALLAQNPGVSAPLTPLLAEHPNVKVQQSPPQLAQSPTVNAQLQALAQNPALNAQLQAVLAQNLGLNTQIPALFAQNRQALIQAPSHAASPASQKLAIGNPGSSYVEQNPETAAVLAPYLKGMLRKQAALVRPAPITRQPMTSTALPIKPTPFVHLVPADLQLSPDCKRVNCDFEGNSCSYEGTDGNNGAWVIMQGRIGSPLTGISRAAFGRYYAVAYTSSNTSTQILRSGNFTTDDKTFLTFWYYFATAESGRMVVCDRSLDNCQWEKTRRSVTVDSRRWRRGTILLPAGAHQVLFVVENLTENHFVGLDQVYLRSNLTGPFASCLENTGS